MNVQHSRKDAQAQPQKKLHWSWLAKQVRLANLSLNEIETLSQSLGSIPLDFTVIRMVRKQVATLA
jgi:hypothetical protein